MSVLCYCLIGTRFQLDDVSACCKVNVGIRSSGCQWLDEVYLEGPV